MPMRRFVLAGASLALVAAGPAAAKKDDPIVAPDAIVESDAANADALAEDWVAGREMEIENLDRLEDAQKRFDKARKAVGKTEDRLDDARERAQERQTEYTALVRGFGRARTPQEADEEAKALRKVAGRWEDAYERVEDLEEDLVEARADAAAAERTLADVSAAVEMGRSRMRRAESQAGMRNADARGDRRKRRGEVASSTSASGDGGEGA